MRISDWRSDVCSSDLKCRLYRPHDVVVVNDLFCAVVTQCRHAAAPVHQRFGQPCHADEGMAGNQHGFGESGSGAIGEPAMQILFAGPGNGMEQEVEAPPAIPDFCKHGLTLRSEKHTSE